MPDKAIKCVECSNDFTFTDGEQAFYESKGFHVPKRCQDCRKKKRDGFTKDRHAKK